MSRLRAGVAPSAILVLAMCQDLMAVGTWTPRFQTPTDEIVLVFSSPDDSTAWFITNFDRIYKTSNGGATWTSLTTGAFIPSGLFVVDNLTAFKTSSNALWKTTNGGVTWTSVFSLAGAGPPVVWMTTASSGFMAFDGRLYRTTDGGDHWSLAGVTQPPSPILTGRGKGNICVAGSNLWVAIANDGVAVSPDLGASWIVPGNHGLPPGGTVRISFANASFGLSIQRSNPFIYVTTDSANNWVETDNSLGVNEDVLAVGTQCWYIPNPSDHDYIKYSADAGATWVVQLVDPDAGLSVLDRSRSGYTLWSGTARGRIYTYQNDERTDVAPAGVADPLAWVMPNPCGDRLQLSESIARDAVRYRIITVGGEVASSGAIRDGTIETRPLAAGCYVLEVTDARGATKHSIRMVKR